MRQIILDTETTGLDPKLGHRIIELAAIEMVDRRPTGRTLQVYIDPEREIDAGASEVHGIRWNLDEGFIENAHVRLSFDLWKGTITGLLSKEGNWQAIPGGAGANDVVREQDYGNFWQYNGPCRGDAFNPMPGRYPLPAPDSGRADFS